MSLQRKAIRQKMAEKIIQANTLVGEKVFQSRVRAFFPEELPAVCVYFSNETTETFNESPRELLRTAKMRVEILAKADEDLEDFLDQMGDQVERAIHKSTDLDGAVREIILSEAQTALLGDGDSPVGSLMLTFDAEYFTLVPVDEDGEDEAEVSAFRQVRTNYRPNAATANSPQPGEKILLDQDDDLDHDGIPDDEQ